MTVRTALCVGIAAIVLGLIGFATSEAIAADAPSVAAKTATGPKWQNLFDGKTLKGWKAPQFGGEGKVSVLNGTILLERGDTMTGIAYTGKVPSADYEVAFEGKRVEGSDFFATATFPVGDTHCSFVLGGWGGTVVGLSTVDFYDAADNQTTRTATFKRDQWYRIRVRVTKQRIQCWIDDEKMVNLVYKDPKDSSKNHKIGIRSECDLCRPLGICSWCTTGAVRTIRLRGLSAEEAASKPADETEE